MISKWPFRSSHSIKVEGQVEIEILGGGISEAALFVIMDQLRCAAKRAIAENTADAPKRKPCGCPDKPDA